MNYDHESLKMHKEKKGKLEIASKVPLNNKDDLSIGYTPGVAEPCRMIHKDKSLVYDYTIKGNYIAVVTDGSAVLGLGDIGPEAGLPVMEGKCILFKEFGGVDAVPLCLDTQDPDEIVQIVTKLTPAFGGINLEDISAPRCFEIEEKIKKNTDIPVFHDDQHGTAVVTSAAIINSLKIVDKRLEEVKIVVCGAGSAGVAIIRLLEKMGARHILPMDRYGLLSRSQDLDPVRLELAEKFNPAGDTISLEEALKGADIFIGVSKPGLLTEEMVASMNRDAIIFAMANPIAEIEPALAKKAGARIVGTGRSDYPNQVNNVLAFPGIFRGALDARATDINEEMKIAAARALASLAEKEMHEDYVLPKAFDREVGPHVAAAVAQAAVQSGVARIQITYEEELAQARKMMQGK